MDTEMLGNLLAAAILKSACAEAQCRVSAEGHPWYVTVVHLDDTHTCPFHEAGEYQSRVISTGTLLTTPREVLVGSVAVWLSHLHEHARSGSDAAGATRDADASASAAQCTAGLLDALSAGASDGDRVGSVPRD